MSKVARELDLKYQIEQLQHCQIQRGSGLCVGLKTQALCSVLDTPDCLQEYTYPPTPQSVAKLEALEVTSEAEGEGDKLEVPDQFKPLLWVQPDWRFWLGVSLVGAGLWLYRNK